MKKKKRIIIFLGCILICVVAYFFSYKKLENVLNVDYDKIDKITIFSGTTGKAAEITDKEEIKKYLKMFEGIKVRPSINQMKTYGFSLESDFYIGDSKVAYMIYGFSKMQINGIKYISNKNIDENQIDQIEEKYKLSISN